MNEIAEYFDNLADDWEDRLCEPSPVCATVARIADVCEGSRVLDLGCGTGVMAPSYLDLAPKQVVALDLAPRMIEIAKEKYADKPTLVFRCCDVLDYEDEQLFDTVVIYNAYPHFLEKEALAAKVASLLKTGGRITVAHGMGRAQMNDHHKNVPATITSQLLSPAEEAAVWQEVGFHIDALCDTPRFYCFSGSKA